MANKHYFQVPDSEFDRAAGTKALDSKQANQALQNPVQQPAVSGGMGKQAQQTGLVFAEKYEALPFSAAYQARLGIEEKSETPKPPLFPRITNQVEEELPRCVPGHRRRATVSDLQPLRFLIESLPEVCL